MSRSARRVGIVAAAMLAGIALAAALPQEQTQRHVAAGAAPLCRAGAQLGRVRVTPGFAWRADQKERERREAIALRALRAELAELPCARQVSIVGAGSAATDDADVELAVRVYELGPNLVVTLVPPQWLGWTEVALALRAVRLADGATLLDAHVVRRRGGPFALRGVEPLEAELRAALAPLLRAEPVR